jgi:glucose/arabinose dehydrogenase
MLISFSLPLAACGGGAGSTAASISTEAAQTKAGASKTEAARPTSAADPAAGASDTRLSRVSLAVPAANGSEPFNVSHTVTLPSHWSAEVWARVPGARFVLWTDEHTLLVSATDYGEIVELFPGTDAAQPPRRRVLATGLTMPEGMAFDTLDGQRVLYVAQSNQIDRYRWLGGGRLGARTVVISNLPDTGPPAEDTHRLKSVAVGPDHEIYFSIGSVSNAKAPDAGEYPPRASIMAIAPSGKHLRVFARGVRNGEGLAFAPDGSLWTAVNERDEVPYPFHRAYGGDGEAYGQMIRSYVNEHPPDEVARLTAGRQLGWPFCNPDPDDTPGKPELGLHYGELSFVADAVTNPDERTLDCRTLKPLERGLPGHTAPLGLTFLHGSSIAAPWSEGAVLGAHGSWDRVPPRAPALLWLPWEAARHTLGEPITLLGGFQDASGARWGRPVDAVPGPEGMLYVTDDLAGAIYRIGPTGG